METNNTGFLVGTLQSALAGKGDTDFSETKKALGFDEDSEFSRFLDGCQQLVKIGETS